MPPIFKGPLFEFHRQQYNAKRRAYSALPVAHGVVNEEDFTNQKTGRPTRKDLEMQRMRKEGKDIDEQR